jgi:phosphotriesterase-related protein
MIHPGRHPRAPREHLREAERSGADPTRTVIAHVDRRIADTTVLGELARSGCYLEFDCFGLEPWLEAETSACPMPCDLERVELIEWLMDGGFTEQLLVAQDICMKHRLAAYGGHGFDHVIRTIVPILRGRGASQSEVDAILVHNPQRMLGLRDRRADPGPAPDAEVRA